MYYGLTRRNQLREMMLDVCEALKGNNEDLKSTLVLMLATCYQETNFGGFKDPTPYRAGAGLMQFDKMPFEDIRDRGGRFYKVVLRNFGIDVPSLTHRELEFSPLASIVMARIKYKLVPSKIPSWDDFEGQWLYYKKWYNSYLGRATKEEFLVSYNKAIAEYKEY